MTFFRMCFFITFMLFRLTIFNWPAEDLLAADQEVKLKDIACEGYGLKIAELGGVIIEIGSERYVVETSLSFPGKSVGYNFLGLERKSGESNWQPKVIINGSEIEVEARGDFYHLLRRIKVSPDCLKITDKYSNLSKEPIGILINNSLTPAQLKGKDNYYISGVPDIDHLSVGNAANPTLFVIQEQSALGFLAEDSVYRLQLEIAKDGKRFDCSTKHFGLDTGAVYEIEWKLYPRKNRDYWDFINQVRRDWNVNYTIEGPFCFGVPSDPSRQIFKITTVGPWIDYQEYVTQGYSRSSYKEKFHPIVQQLRERFPSNYFMPKLENNLITIDTRTFVNGEKLPCSETRKAGKYGIELSKPQSDILARTSFIDSALRTEDGRIIADTYYAQCPFINLLVYPGLGNSRYQHFFNQIDFMFDEVGFNSIYIDQFELGNSEIAKKDRRSFERWDGRSVDIDEQTGRIKKKYTDAPLVGAEAQKKILEYILNRGGKVVVNGFPCTRETQSIPVFHFSEMENDPVNLLTYMDEKPPVFPYQAKGHLSSPIVLGIRPERQGEIGKSRYAEMITKAVITGLRNGLLYYYYGINIPKDGPGSGDFSPVNHMFPFTPVELHAGWLVGKERIITCLSGTYDWKSSDKPQCRRFNIKGQETDSECNIIKDKNTWKITVVISDWNEVVVIE